MRADRLQAFLTFSQTMNFTRAAAELNISQPALHVKIGKLAEGLGQPLYHKAGRNLVLTPAGEMVAAYAREEQERLLAFTADLHQGAGRRPVVLCAGNGAYLYLHGPAISQFSQDPAYALSLITGDRDRTLHLLLTGQAHLGVTAPGATPDGIAAEALTDVGQMLAVPRHHRSGGEAECEAGRPGRRAAHRPAARPAAPHHARPRADERRRHLARGGGGQRLGSTSSRSS